MNHEYLPNYQICDAVLEKLYANGKCTAQYMGGWEEIGPADAIQMASVTLSEDGYIEQLNNSILTTRIKLKGIAFFKSGGYKSYLSDLKERQEIESETLRINRGNVKFQKRYGNPMLVINIIISIVSILISALVAYYISTKEKPTINNIIINIDSSMTNNIIRQRIDTSTYYNNKK